MVKIPEPMKLVIAIGGIFGSFSYFALLQEDLFKKQYDGQKFKSTFFMMVAERGVNAIVALVFLLVNIVLPSQICQIFPLAICNYE